MKRKLKNNLMHKTNTTQQMDDDAFKFYRFGYHPESQPVVYYRLANHHIKPKFVSSELQHACSWSGFQKNRGKI